MERRHKTLFCVIAIAVALVAASATARAQSFIQGFKLPVFFNRSEMQKGQTNYLKTLVTGNSAVQQTNGWLLIDQPRITHFFPDGRTNLVATSPACFLDQKQRTVFSTNLLRMVAGTNQMTVEGTGYFGHLTNLFLIFSNEVTTVIRQELASSSRTNAGLLGSAAKSIARTNSEIQITSQRLHLDYEKNLAVYFRDVHVENVTTDLRAEKLTLKRTPEGNLENILAETNVVIRQKLEPGWATAERALYYMRDGQEALMLAGEPAKWNQGERFGQAGWITYYMNERILRAEDKASVRFPLTGITHTDWLPGPRRTPEAREDARPPEKAASREGERPREPAPQFMEVHAEVITSWLSMTNRPGHRVVAQTNVVIIGFPDEMLATAVNAEYVEALGTLELTGDGYWQQGQRIVRGDRLFYDRTNQVFVSEGNSYLQVPVSEFGRQGKTNKSQLVQAESARFDYRNGYLSFYDKVRATLVETNTIRGRLFADDFVRIKGTNQVEQVRARGNVHGEQFTVPTLSGQMKSNKVDCEFLTVELETNGALRRVFADTNVVTQQFRVRSNKVSHTSLAAESLFADFFTHTNDIREAIAERNVVIISDDSTAKGQRATYSASNTVAELTGSPTLETARIKIDQADAIFYDRSTGKLSAGKPQGQARAPTNALKQAPLPGGGKL